MPTPKPNARHLLFQWYMNQLKNFVSHKDHRKPLIWTLALLFVAVFALSKSIPSKSLFAGQNWGPILSYGGVLFFLMFSLSRSWSQWQKPQIQTLYLIAGPKLNPQRFFLDKILLGICYILSLCYGIYRFEGLGILKWAFISSIMIVGGHYTSIRFSQKDKPIKDAKLKISLDSRSLVFLEAKRVLLYTLRFENTFFPLVLS